MFHIRPDAGEPLYLQLMRQIKHAVATGALLPGAQLPTVRQLASELVINPNTVARAYRELEAEGLIEGVAGRGSFISYGPPKMREAERKRRLETYIDQLWAEGHALGYSATELADVVQASLRKRAAAERPR